MLLRPEHARALLPRVDPGRMYKGLPVGLRDGALLALLAAGLSVPEISRLCASSVNMARGKVLVAVNRHDIPWCAALPTDLGSRLLAWLTERRLWAAAEPVFTGPQGPLTRMGIYNVLKRYRSGSKESR